ncbi:MAG: hypothetical protein ACUZ8H_12735 [Candidatus Anammoxibacter sp.]
MCSKRQRSRARGWCGFSVVVERMQTGYEYITTGLHEYECVGKRYETDRDKDAIADMAEPLYSNWTVIRSGDLVKPVHLEDLVHLLFAS